MRSLQGALALAMLLGIAMPAAAAVHGPYNGEFPAGGDGLAFPFDLKGPQYGWARQNALDNTHPTPLPDSDWSLYGWIDASEIAPGRTVIGGAGDPKSGGRFLVLEDGRLAVWSVAGSVTGDAKPSANAWHFVAAVRHGATVSLYLDGRPAGEGPLAGAPTLSLMQLAPRGLGAPFAGKIAGLTEEDRALSGSDIAALAARRPDVDRIVFPNGSPTWPVQTHQMYGQVAPQDPWTLPKSQSAHPYTAPAAKPAYAGPALVKRSDEVWTLAKWNLAAAPDVTGAGEAISRPGYDARRWYAATVPGTVEQTLIDRGIYPDPDYGLNNLLIPESLHANDYWYRTEFSAPPALHGRRLQLVFNGANYAAEVWVNGKRVGAMKGAFARGAFDVTPLLKPGAANAVAVKVSPVPHPGIAEEESVAAGVGENGGIQAIDGPTFIASEGWDWIPSVRDRDTGLWQNVELRATGDVRIGDVHVVTTLPRPDNSVADVAIDVPVTNLSDRPVTARLSLKFDSVAIDRSVTLRPGTTTVAFSPATDRALSVPHPKLWWPNGYGEPALHMLHVTAAIGAAASDAQDVRFGMREITYDLSLMDGSGHVRRVELDFARARGRQLVDVRHEAIRKVPDGWVYSFAPGAENSPAVAPADDVQLAPFLVIKVNGVKIAARGGSWGTDDWLKRVSRDRLEPFFRLHRDAHVNIIRNWVGQNTEPVFYDLADEYGILVLNDFWESTQDYQIEAQDVPLFLANVADTVARYRNHPSIALWFGRNEGVPQPVLNEGIERLVREEDGTRIYMPSSNRINLHDSGPYHYYDIAKYFTEFSNGFAVEVGASSFPTLEAFESAVPPEDRWPMGDVWAYHDWHPDGNGDTHGFVDALSAKYGAPADLADFDRKVQMMDYDVYRAIFEGMNARLWTANSGRLLWMTQPAWPSTNWQILSHDYDTQASYYGFKSAAEPVHVQMDLPDHRLAVVNNRLTPLRGATVTASIYDLSGKRLSETKQAIDVDANAVAHADALDPFAAAGTVVVELTLTSSSGEALSRNVYWLARSDDDSRAFASLPPQPVTLSATTARDGGETVVTATLHNTGTAPALQAKLTLVDAKGARILPAYYEDNYISLLPGETRRVTIRYPANAAAGPPHVALRGFDVAPIAVGAP